ncbi:MAG: hypothetical protein KAG26_08415 [Methylococcales bacterium]|nr:hypothetical protein [Methylococcales bacterium]
MKWAIVIVLCFISNTQNVHSQMNKHYSSISQHDFNIQNNQYELFLPYFLNLDPTDKLSVDLTYDSIVDMISIALLVIATIFVVTTPLFLLFFWIYFSIIYVKKYRRIFSLKKWLHKKIQLREKHIQKEIWWPYRKVYSCMLGFGISIIAYVIFSIKFMSSNFDKMETALTGYFNFPFKVLENLKEMKTIQTNSIQIDELWDEMFLIVIMSVVFFMIGFLIGSLIVDFRFKLMIKKIQKEARRIKLNKEMFYIKLNNEIDAEDRLRVKEVY